ncbi:hypothetical protein B7486_71125, partial [cyanobacterium TDX16]
RLRQIIDEVMFEIRELSGQEYRDTYATKKAEDIPGRTAGVITADGPQRSANDGHQNGHGSNGDGGSGGAGDDAPRRSSADVLRSA